MGYAEYLGLAKGLEAASPWLMEAMIAPERERLARGKERQGFLLDLLKRGELMREELPFAASRELPLIQTPESRLAEFISAAPTQRRATLPETFDVLEASRSGIIPPGYEIRSTYPKMGAITPELRQMWIEAGLGDPGAAFAPGTAGMFGAAAAARRRTSSADIQKQRFEYAKTKDDSTAWKWAHERALAEWAVVPAAMQDPDVRGKVETRRQEIFDEITGKKRPEKSFNPLGLTPPPK